MRKMSTSFIHGAIFALSCIALQAQTPATTPVGSNAAVTPSPAGQAPDEATKKITDLFHAGKYLEAEKLTEGLLIAYPEDQRLIKAKALIASALEQGGASGAAPSSSRPAAHSDVEPLTGMDRVEYNSLVELAKQAQQDSDLGQQEESLRGFMDKSAAFLQKHPSQMLLWQFRVAAAIILDDPMAGYEAGQKLLAAGAADSDDPNLQHLLAQLNNKGWLDKQDAAMQADRVWRDAKKQIDFDWILGTWGALFSYDDLKALPDTSVASHITVTFSRSGSVIEGHSFYDGVKDPRFASDLVGSEYKGIILHSGEIHWEWTQGPSFTEWMPAISFQSREGNRQMTIVFSSSNYKTMGACTALFTRVTPR
jgi:hypothetical protein